METHLSSYWQARPEGVLAQEILRACVHCGFCNATCPTYQLTGDERDGPRGRIYQIKGMMEGDEPNVLNQQHLDRCLTCRSCETTCPSGVRYSTLVDIGRMAVAEKISRPLPQRVFRRVLVWGLSSPRLFGVAMGFAQKARPLLRFVLPRKILAKIPAPQARLTSLVSALPTPPRLARAEPLQVLYFEGCVQPFMSPNINHAMQQVFSLMGVALTPVSGCCGALHHHLGDEWAHHQGLAQVRQQVDACFALLTGDAAMPIDKALAQPTKYQVILSNASGCGLMLKDYGRLLANDAAYAQKAAFVSALVRDPVELLSEWLAEAVTQWQAAGWLVAPDNTPLAFHTPCTLQHGLKQTGAVEKLLSLLGAKAVAVADGHLCCGSAGTYAIFQPELSANLRKNKLNALSINQPQLILSANIGCISQLQSTDDDAKPVYHWLEWVATRLGVAQTALSPQNNF